MSADPGSWSGSPAPTFTYQWQQCDAAGQNCADIASATNASYQLAAGDVGATVRVVVTGSNSAGSASAASVVSAVVAAAPVAPHKYGVAVVERFGGAGSVACRRIRAAGRGRRRRRSRISGSSVTLPARTVPISRRRRTASYQLAAGDVGATVRVVVTGSNSAGSASAASVVSAVVAAAPVAPTNTALPSLSGSAVQGQSLVGGSGQLDRGRRRRRSRISGGSVTLPARTVPTSLRRRTASYQLAAGDVGATVRVVVTGSNSAGSASAASVVSAVVAAAPVAPTNTALPSLSGSPVQGQSLDGGSGQLVGVAGADVHVSVAAV